MNALVTSTPVRLMEKLLVKIDGWDKCGKCVQYGGNLLAWQLAGLYRPGVEHAPNNDIITRVLYTTNPAGLSNFTSVVSSVRKVMRLGKCLYILPTVLDESGELGARLSKGTGASRHCEMPMWLLLTSLVSGWAGFLSDASENLHWAVKMGLLPQRWGEATDVPGSIAFLISSLGDLYFSAREMMQLSQDVKALKTGATEEAKTELRNRTFKLTMAKAMVIKYAMDSVVASMELYNMDRTRNGKFLKLSAGLTSGVAAAFKIVRVALRDM